MSGHQSKPYAQAQQALYETPCDLSAYRLMGLDGGWIVAVLGSAPPEELRRRVQDILATGESVVLPDEVLAQLNRRRIEQTKKGAWVERHYRPRRRTRDN